MSSDLKGRIQADLNEARRQRDKDRTLVLSTILSDLKNRELEAGGTLSDDDGVQVIAKAIKQRKDAGDQMREAGRHELAAVEDAQAAVLQAYLPAGLSEDEVRAMIREIVADGATAMGAVMGRLMPKIRGRFDGKEANRVVKEELDG
ncbi:MAG TPA: GatB/YqeY domain-containing protein [Longimicrobiales bacterium]|nr:GatB/YqeY domain-containing protein [Longimicrobiales bacterium]